MLASANSTSPVHANRSAPPIRHDIPQAPRKITGMLAKASECTTINIRATWSTSAGLIFPPGWEIMVIIIPTDPAISAIALLRSSVMRQTLEMASRDVNAPSQEMPGYRTKRRPMSRNSSASRSKIVNARAQKVPGRTAQKKKTVSSAVTKKMDHRVRITRDALGDALVALMHEKPFETITVQHVLDRAHVSRSTFYTHYSDKNDLFLSDVEDFFEMMSTALIRHGDTSHRVAPVREFFSHIADMRQF